MTQYLDKEGLEYYTSKMKSYIRSQASGISQDDADKRYASKSIATTTSDGLMDKDSFSKVSTCISYSDLESRYKIDDIALSGEVFSIATFYGVVNVSADKINEGSGTAGAKVVYNATTGSFVAQVENAGASGITYDYYSNVAPTYGTQYNTTSGATPFENHIYINGNTDVMYMYRNGSLVQVSPTSITNSEIDEMLA